MSDSRHEDEARREPLVFDGVEVGDDESRNPPENVASARATLRGVGKSKLAVLAILFLATGFLGIPLLFYSERFSTTERVVWSIVVTLYTVALIALVVVVMMWTWGRISGLN